MSKKMGLFSEILNEQTQAVDPYEFGAPVAPSSGLGQELERQRLERQYKAFKERNPNIEPAIAAAAGLTPVGRIVKTLGAGAKVAKDIFPGLGDKPTTSAQASQAVRGQSAPTVWRNPRTGEVSSVPGAQPATSTVTPPQTTPDKSSVIPAAEYQKRFTDKLNQLQQTVPGTTKTTDKTISAPDYSPKNAYTIIKQPPIKEPSTTLTPDKAPVIRGEQPSASYIKSKPDKTAKEPTPVAKEPESPETPRKIFTPGRLKTAAALGGLGGAAEVLDQTGLLPYAEYPERFIEPITSKIVPSLGYVQRQQDDAATIARQKLQQKLSDVLDLKEQKAPKLFTSLRPPPGAPKEPLKKRYTTDLKEPLPNKPYTPVINPSFSPQRFQSSMKPAPTDTPDVYTGRRTPPGVSSQDIKSADDALAAASVRYQKLAGVKPSTVDPWKTEPGFAASVPTDPWQQEPGFDTSKPVDPWKAEPGFATSVPTDPWQQEPGFDASKPIDPWKTEPGFAQSSATTPDSSAKSTVKQSTPLNKNIAFSISPEDQKQRELERQQTRAKAMDYLSKNIGQINPAAWSDTDLTNLANIQTGPGVQESILDLKKLSGMVK